MILWNPGRKRKRRKARYLKSPAPPWTGLHKTNRRRSARRDRYAAKQDCRQ